MIRDWNRVGDRMATIGISPGLIRRSRPLNTASAAPTRAIVFDLPDRRPHRSKHSSYPSFESFDGSRPVHFRTISRSFFVVFRP